MSEKRTASPSAGPPAGRSLQADAAGRVPFFMIGQRLLQDLVSDRLPGPIYERMASAGVLKPLSAQETRDFIERELRAQDWNDCPAFDPDVFHIIHRFSGGLPADIATLCNQLLLQCYVEQSPRVTAARAQENAQEISHGGRANIDAAFCATQPLESPAADDRQAPDPPPQREIPRQAAAPEPPVEPPAPSAPEPGKRAVFTSRSLTKPGRSARRGNW